MATGIVPRGVRNCNPLNIRRGSKWLGLASHQDGEFCTFVSNDWGVRAACKILHSYARRGIRTVAEIIRTWAPPSENDTETYIQIVCSRTGFRPNHQIDVYDEDTMVALLLAMAWVECSTVFDESEFRLGFRRFMRYMSNILRPVRH